MATATAAPGAQRSPPLWPPPRRPENRRASFRASRSLEAHDPDSDEFPTSPMSSRFPNRSVVTAAEELDPAARALLDLSLRSGMDDEQLAAAGQRPSTSSRPSVPRRSSS